jgi:hypothetical protein
MLKVGSPPPTLACPHCRRHFHSKGGRTKHIQAKHHANASGPNPHASNRDLVVTLPPSPVSSSESSHSSFHNVQFEGHPSPTLFPPSHGEADNFADIGIDAEYRHFDQDYIPPDLTVGDEDLPRRDNHMEQHAPNPPHITHIYHPKLDGK